MGFDSCLLAVPKQNSPHYLNGEFCLGDLRDRIFHQEGLSLLESLRTNGLDRSDGLGGLAQHTGER